MAARRLVEQLKNVRSLTAAEGTQARLDAFLTRHVPGCSRRTVQRAIAAGAVRINGRRARKGQMVAAGDLIELPDDLNEPGTLPPNPQLAVPVLYEDAALVALDKPAGMPSHALRLTETATAANFLLARYPEMGTIGNSPREPGIVHRLDTDTSGVLLAARTQHAYAELRRQFSAHLVTKEYIALVLGDVSEPGTVDTPIGHDSHNRRKMRVGRGTGRARDARTSYRPLERFGHHTLLAVQMQTGVRHQIRVHLAAIGHPLAGDRLYAKATQPAAPRQLLHASRVRCVHPETGQPIAISSPLAADFAAYVESLHLAPPPAHRRQTT